MAEVQSSFGQPTLLLGGLSAIEATSAYQDASTSVANAKAEDFSANGLLEDTIMGEGGDLTSSRALVDTGSNFGIASELAEDSFLLNGLLGGSSPAACPSSPSTSIAELTDQPLSQEEDFPDVHDLARPYTARAAGSSAGAVQTSVSATTLPPHLSRLSIRATTFDGLPVYLRRKPRKFTSAFNESDTRPKIGNLLDVPIHRLLDDLSRKTARKMTQQDEESQQSESQSQQCSASGSQETSLWVDRYRPKKFTDLLGDDRVHREVMAWVKEWDFCVFGKNKGKKRARDDDNPDEYRRPHERLLLISGPPGLGKTTLAHVVAKQAGYAVYEVNASDARSAQVVDDRIQPALESGCRVGSSKPTLVVVDEIDGATGGGEGSGGFINRLLQLTQDKHKKKPKKGEQQAHRPLLRPIICICNDLYASSLAKLRTHARVIRFNRPNDFRLVKRLRDICETEGLRAESRALTTLVGVAQGDLRGCLNTLQLIKAKNEEVTEHIVRSATAGMKEAEVSQLSVLNDLFTPLARKRAKELGIGEEEEAKYVARLSREIEASGATDKIAIGCFEHYATLRKHDATFTRYLRAGEWLSIYDVFSGEMRTEREYALLQYLSYMLVPFYPLFQERGAQKVERPKADWENYTKTKTNEEVYKSLARGLRTATARCGGAYRHLAGDDVLRLEVAPLLNRIIAPPLRPVNQQIIKPEERALLTRLVDVMASLEICFVQERSEEGQLMYRLDPPIDAFVTYDGKRAADITVSRYAVRHLVATEIDAQLVGRRASAVETTKGGAQGSFTKRTRDADDLGGDDGAGGGDGRLLSAPVDISAHPAKRVCRDEAPPAVKVATDFFGRPIVLKNGETRPVSQAAEKKPGVSYRFNEGNSAAVRKPVKVSTFL